MSATAFPMAGSPVPTGLRELATEDERIWTRVWACVGVEHQIPAPGDLLPATVGATVAVESLPTLRDILRSNGVAFVDDGNRICIRSEDACNTLLEFRELAEVTP